LVHDWGFVDSVWITAAALGYCYASLGRVQEALPFIDNALGSFGQIINWPRWSAHIVVQGLLLCGRTSDAEQLARDTLQSATQAGARGEEAWQRWLLGETRCKADGGDLGEAEQLLRQALALSQELGMRPLIAHYHSGLGKLYAKKGGRAQAQRHRACAAAIYREGSMQFYVEKAEAALLAL
jgi:tetratricopeptide (TPR) repeat protein